MSNSEIADRIIELADRLGYGVDVRFTMTKNPIKIKPLRGQSVSFSSFKGALDYLENVNNRVINF
jgi:hypothetical protein